MAALPDSPRVKVVDLRSICGGELAPMLAQERSAWREQLDWDFSASADLVERFVNMQALSGYALLSGNRVIGYSYYVTEDRKGLIGDLYVEPDFRTDHNEDLLLQAVMRALLDTPYIRRIESQLMMVRSPLDRDLPHTSNLATFKRQFMVAPLAGSRNLPAGKPLENMWIDNWREERQDEAAQLIAAAYQGHVDSEINDQYRSASGARRFLQNIVQFPGCGAFFQPASLVAVDSRTGRVAGVILSSLVAEEVGHITQICVAKPARGTGLGYELLRRCLTALEEWGCRRVSLTVTSSNQRAIAMYDRLGFSVRRYFAAYVWDGFRPATGFASLIS